MVQTNAVLASTREDDEGYLPPRPLRLCTSVPSTCPNGHDIHL